MLSAWGSGSLKTATRRANESWSAVPSDPENRGAERKANLILFGLASAYFLLELVPGVIGAYRYFIDEFYYLACANHLAPGYVDHPPLSVCLLWLIRAIIGDSLPALRVVPALAGAVTIGLVGMIARRLGAGWQGQAVAVATTL